MSAIIRSVWLVVGIGALGVLCGSPSTGAGSARLIPTARRHLPIVIRERRNNSVTSTNWSGYAVTASRGAVTDVKGSWKIPAVSCSGSNQYASLWVGIDGYNSNTVEQIGTDSDCQGDTPTYYAWYEFYPHFSYLIDLGAPIGFADVMSAEVKSSADGTFTVLLTDQTTGGSFKTTAKMNSARRSSAEWILEAPWSGGVLPLANFGTAEFGANNTEVAGTSVTTIGNTTGTIGSFGSPTDPKSPVQQITMVTSGGAIKAQPQGLSADGSSFEIDWVSSGP
jgi:peptidase A4-like protein